MGITKKTFTDMHIYLDRYFPINGLGMSRGRIAGSIYSFSSGD